ncbi:hairy-related 3 [Astyanax mexicanus]|uniref:hairy-related 3 n=1 Tax=Astyanax mexicanus TaxID=7994 RepID=UPI0020CB4227|nr:hairy-related 3 [Astyanax mexicanus]
MVSDSLRKTKISIHKKVSKPMMEKKRRARINTCLDQLKTLLENIYSNNISKRKLEKADILELTVKHLKHLQKSEKGLAINSGGSEYQSGYTTCLASVNQYLLTADANTASRSTMLAHLSRSLLRLGAPAPSFSTTDRDCASSPPSKKQRRHDTLSTRHQIFTKDQKPAHGLFDHHKHIHVNRSCSAPASLQQNYWRPW